MTTAQSLITYTGTNRRFDSRILHYRRFEAAKQKSRHPPASEAMGNRQHKQAHTQANNHAHKHTRIHPQTEKRQTHTNTSTHKQTRTNTHTTPRTKKQAQTPREGQTRTSRSARQQVARLGQNYAVALIGSNRTTTTTPTNNYTNNYTNNCIFPSQPCYC